METENVTEAIAKSHAPTMIPFFPLQGQKMAGPGLVTTAVLLLLCWGTHQINAQG